ncbi:MAG: four helix bundle protein [Candidatus Marinimicrobia bacterium]|nr:four helix bundle protein [Candidatus Neomarinimicrobiota bacterium]MCF7829165.1 four helix bundle protein [Candidatus Neomarinimicrobiota bacterium]MCF7881182.1 four helix bundle protein [Candidatus Neomarinimicrobiota bacterium]
MKEIHELDVYQLAEKLADKVWYNFDEWPVKAQNTIGYQIIRSADSISANISEGYGRYTPKERKLFYRYARSSFEETKCWLRKLIRRDLITEEDAVYFRDIIDELGPKLNAFINSTR